MSQYLIYGKRTEAILNTDTHKFMGPDSSFRALNEKGERVSKLSDAFSFATKEDAQEFLDAHKPKHGVVFEIRKAK